MVQGVPEHVFQGCDHALQDAPVHFAFGVADIKVDFLAQFAADLANDAPQTRHHGGERNHPGLHQTLLEFRVDPGLLHKQGFGVPYPVRQGFPQVCKVRGGLGQSPGQLLDGGVAVHLQRVEVVAVIRSVFFLGTEQDLGFGLDFHPA